MRGPLLWQLAILPLLAGSAFPSPGTAQSRSDTIGVASAIAQRFDSLQVRGIVAAACGSLWTCEPIAGSSAWHETLRSLAPARMAPPGPPPCAWNRDASAREAGYEMQLAIRHLSEDRAIVYSIRSCRTSPGDLHATYKLGEEFEFERSGAEWVLRGWRGRWVT
jgi:hypothetical protein